MQETIIRRAVTADLPELSRLWLEHRTVQQQFDRRVTLAADGRAVWQDRAAGWLHDARCAVVVGTGDSGLYGYAIGWIQPNPPGLVPERLGIITDLVLDAHQYRGGLGRSLVMTLRNWFVGQGVEQMVALVPHRHAVEQAFWRSLGAVEWMDVVWLK